MGTVRKAYLIPYNLYTKGDETMPMDFPDLESLKRAAGIWKFREIKDEETEDHYRNALADFVADKDFIESQEIRNKVGWDRWSEEQEKDLLRRSGLFIP